MGFQCSLWNNKKEYTKKSGFDVKCVYQIPRDRMINKLVFSVFLLMKTTITDAHTNISDVPVVSLELSSNVNVSDIKEGIDVFFECNVKSNPWIYRVSWQHNVSIHSKLASTIIMVLCLIFFHFTSHGRLKPSSQRLGKRRITVYQLVSSNQNYDFTEHVLALLKQLVRCCFLYPSLDPRWNFCL